MKNLKSVIVLCSIILFSRCSAKNGGSSLSYENVNEFFGSISYINADVSVNSVTKNDDILFRLAYTKDETNENISVIEPTAISGIKIPLKNGEVCLSENDTAVASEIETESSVTPVNIVPCIINSLANYIPTDIGSEKIGDTQASVLTYDISLDNADYTQRIWLDNSSLSPVKAQTYLDGVCIIECSFNEFTCKQQQN